ncbi:MAG: hypothetical protein FWB74_08225 [Defluviitaleaceae bacterium]|nr:hypothetical protein [Defluviitaleaceae bacterium]
MGYYHVIFQGNTVEFRQIISIDPEDAPDRWYHEAHYMPGTKHKCMKPYAIGYLLQVINK